MKRKQTLTSLYTYLFFGLFLLLATGVFFVDGASALTDQQRAFCFGPADYTSGEGGDEKLKYLGVPQKSDGTVPLHLQNVETIWKLKGQAWGPVTGWVNFGPIRWGEQDHYVLAYKKPKPVSGGTATPMDDEMIFEGLAWGDNVGWINFTTGGAFCVNDTSFEDFNGALSSQLKRL